MTPTFAAPTAHRGQSLSNPAYAFHMPPMLPPQPSMRTVLNRGDDDVELLRKYGLDRFHLNDAQHVPAARSAKSDPFCSPVNGNGSANYVNGISTGNGHRRPCNGQWTTFE